MIAGGASYRCAERRGPPGSRGRRSQALRGVRAVVGCWEVLSATRRESGVPPPRPRIERIVSRMRRDAGTHSARGTQGANARRSRGTRELAARVHASDGYPTTSRTRTSSGSPPDPSRCARGSPSYRWRRRGTRRHQCGDVVAGGNATRARRLHRGRGRLHCSAPRRPDHSSPRPRGPGSSRVHRMCTGNAPTRRAR